MNINEDKFLNKSAKEIVDDMLSQHKTPSDALAHTNELLNDDGLSDKTKEELKKAANMLQDKTNEKELNEGKWLSTIKSMFNPQPKPGYTVELVCYPPFKKEPEVIKLDNIQSLDDPKVDEAYKYIRHLHPKSPIRLYSELGNKTFYENSSAEYQIKAYDKESNRVDSFNAGTLPQAMAMCEKMWNANDAKYKSIEVIHDNNIVTTYNGLEEGFTMDMSAPDPDDSNNDKKDKNQNNEEPQVNPDDPIITIKDKDGNDVNVSMSQDAQTVSIDGQPIEKNAFDQAIEDLKKQADEINKKAKEKDQNNQQEEPEEDQEQDDQQDQNKDEQNPKDQDKNTDQTEENPEKDQDQKDDQANDSSEQNDTEDTTPKEDEYSDEDFYSDTENLGKKGQFQLNKDMSAYDADIERQNQAKAYADELKKQQDDIAAEREMRDFDIQQEREKRDADLAADRNKETKRKSYKDQGGKSLLNKILTSDTARNLAAAGAGAALGFAPSNELTKPYTDHAIDRIDAYNKETQRMNKAKHDYDLKADRNKEIDKAADERLKAKRAKEDQMRQNKNSAVAYKRQDDTQRAIDQKLQRQNLQKQLTRKYANTPGMTRADDIKRDAQLAAQRKAARDAAMNKQAAAKKSKASQDNKKARDTINAKLNKKKSESLNEAELQHSWVDTHKDIANIDEFLELARNGIHPGLADTHRPKFFNTLATNSADKYTEIDGEPYRNKIVLDGVEEIKHPKTGEPVMVAIIKEKIPNTVNPETGAVTYKDGDRFKVTFNQFKRIIEDPENEETLRKFIKTHPDDPELMFTLYQQAKNNMDEMYPNWENSYWDEYKLSNYNPVERAAIYLRWKELLKDTAYQEGHEMTADEVNAEFGIPKIQDNLNKLGSFGAKLDQKAIHNLLKQLPIDKSDELLDQLQSALEDCYELDLNQTEKRIGDFMSTTPVLLACENIINQMTKNSLENIENNVSDDKKDAFESAKSALLNKYITKANIHGSVRKIVDPRIISHKNEIEKYLDNLRKELGITRWSIDVNDIKKQNREQINNRPILKSDEERLRDAGKTIDDYIKWSDEEKSYFVTYRDENGKPISDADTIKDIENYFSKKADLNMNDRVFMLINKLDPEKTTPEELAQKRQDQANSLNSEIERLRNKYKFNLDKVKSQVNSYKPSLSSYIGQLESPFEKDRKRELNNNDPWINTVNSNVYYNKSDADNGIGILDRIDRSLARYEDIDSKGMPIANKYRELLDTLIEQWKKDYPEGNEKELSEVILSWYKDILKPDIAKDTSTDKQLKNYIVGD